MSDDAWILGATDTAWIKTTDSDRKHIKQLIINHARSKPEAAEFFEMITGHKLGSETDQ
jgi:hypothetical protein